LSVDRLLEEPITAALAGGAAARRADAQHYPIAPRPDHHARAWAERAGVSHTRSQMRHARGRLTLSGARTCLIACWRLTLLSRQFHPPDNGGYLGRINPVANPSHFGGQNGGLGKGRSGLSQAPVRQFPHAGQGARSERQVTVLWNLRLRRERRGGGRRGGRVRAWRRAGGGARPRQPAALRARRPLAVSEADGPTPCARTARNRARLASLAASFVLPPIRRDC
jgi:hypothetical protein